MRVNLDGLDDTIRGLQMDLDNLDNDRPPGYQAEIRSIEAEIAEIKGVKARAIQYGTGYRDLRPVQ